MEYIIDKSIITSLANDGCAKNAINIMDSTWKSKLLEETKDHDCYCGSGKKSVNCCLKKEKSRGKIPEYRYIEEHLKIKIPHVDIAPLISHMKAGEFAEIRKIEELSYYNVIGTNIKPKEVKAGDIAKLASLSKFVSNGEPLKIKFNRESFEELGHLIYERKVTGKDFMIGSEDKAITSDGFLRIAKSNIYDYLYQLKFEVRKDFFDKLIGVANLRELYDFTKISFRNYIPDLIKIIKPNDSEYLNCLVFDENINLNKSENIKNKLMVVDIKNSEFSNKFFIELGLYMIALNSFISENKELKEKFEVIAKAAIYPEHEDELEKERYYRIKNAGPNSMKIWQVDFATVREELISVFRKKLPNLISIIENGKTPEYNCIKISPMCMTCDYYGGQNSKQLVDYLENQKKNDTSFPYNSVEEYLNDTENNFCRYYVKNYSDINVIPNLNKGEKNTLLSHSINNINELENAIISKDELFENNRTLKSNVIVLENSISIRKNSEDFRIINSRTINLPKFSNLKIFIDLQSSSKEETLSFAYGLNFLNTNGNFDSIGIQNAEFSISIIDEYTFKHDLKEYLEFLFRINDIVKIYENEKDQFGHNLSYSIVYWGQSTYDNLKRLFLNVFEYIKNDGEGIESIYTGIATAGLNDKKRKVRELKERFYTLFAPEDELQDYRIVEKSPFFDMRKSITDLMVINADINITLQETNKLITGYNTVFRYHKPDSDSFNGYVFGKIWTGEHTNSDERDRFKDDIKSIIRNRIKAMMGVYMKLSENGYLYGVAPTIIPLQRENHFGNFDMGNDLYLYHKLDNAHSLVEIEQIHNDEAYKKSVLGKSMFFEKQFSGIERTEILVQNNFSPSDLSLLVYKVKDYCREANFDEKSFFLTIYPLDKSEYIFMKFCDKRYNNVIYYNPSIYNFSSYKEWYWNSAKPYKSVVEVNIEKFLRFDNIVIIRIPPLTRSLMEFLTNDYGFDFMNNVILEKFHTDIWGKLLKKTLEKIKDNNIAKDILDNFTNIMSDSLSKTKITELLANHYNDKKIPLDDSQYDAIVRILNNKLTLLWGPPGTGKTHTLTHLLLAYYYINKERGAGIKRILIMCNNYDAFDNIIKKMSDQGILDIKDVSIIRMKSKDREERNFKFKNAYYNEISSGETFKDEFKKLIAQKQNYQIIASTPNQIAKIFTNKDYSTNKTIKFDMVIVDEASQMDVGHFTPALLKILENTQFVLAGDDLQLPPISKVKLREANETYYGSVFSYYLNEFHNEVSNNIRASLLCNRRSNSTIVNYSKLTFGYEEGYRAEENDNGKISFVTNESNGDLYDEVIDPNKIICMLNYDDGNANQMNLFEAEEVVNIIIRIWERGVYRYGCNERYSALDFFDKCIGVVVPHRAQRTQVQIKLIAHFLDKLKIYQLEGNSRKEIEEKIISCVDTVERYQGQEREIMICSYVLGDTDIIKQEEEFIYNPNRLNVMVSRARFKVIVLASNELTMNISDNLDIIKIQQSLKKLVDYCKSSYEIENHPTWHERHGILRYITNES